MRTRSRLITLSSSPGGPLEYWYNGVYQNSNQASTANAEMESETIIDEPTGRGWKACNHVVERNYLNSSTEAGWGRLGNNPVIKGPNAYWYVWWNNQKPGLSGAGEFNYSFPKPVTQQAVELLHSYYAENQVDNLLNVMESPQLPQSLEQLASTAGRPSVKKALGKISNGFLFWSFGLAPLLSDMRKMANSFTTFRSDMKKAIEDDRKTKIIRSTVQGTYNGFKTASHSYGGIADVVSGGSAARVVALRVQNRALYNSASFRQLDYILRKFGSPGPASLIWERIPFSFVVDWFLDTRSVFDALNNFLTGNQKGVVEGPLVTTRGSGWTTWTDRTMGHYPFPGFNGTQVANSSIRIYTREKLVQALSPKIRMHERFGKKQAALSAALLYQQIARRFGK